MNYHFKNYFSLFFTSFIHPLRSAEEVLKKSRNFHVLYFSIFNFIFGSIAAFGIALTTTENNEVFGTIELNQIEILGAFMLIVPLSLFMCCLFVDFVSTYALKTKGGLMKFYAVLLWAYHLSLFIFIATTPLVLLIELTPEFIAFYLKLILMFTPILYMVTYFLIGLKLGVTESWSKTFLVLVLAVTLFIVPSYFFSN